MILALDQGTTSSRAVLVDHEGNIVASAQRELTQHYPQPGWVEQDAEEIWDTQLAIGARRAGAAGRPAAPPDIAAVASPTSARPPSCGSAPPACRSRPPSCGRTGAPPSAASSCAAPAASAVRRKTGLLLDPYFSATKLRWILDARAPRLGPRARRRARLRHRGLLARLAAHGRPLHVTDATNASRTPLYDIHRGAWDDELLALFGVPRELLPRCATARARSASRSRRCSASRCPSPPCGRRPAGGAVRPGLHAPGLAKVTYGTGCFLLPHAARSRRVARRLLTTVALQRDGGARTPSRAASSSAARRSVAARLLGILGSRVSRRRSRRRSRQARAGSSSPRSPASARPTGTPRREAPFSASRWASTRGPPGPRGARGHRLPGRRPGSAP